MDVVTSTSHTGFFLFEGLELGSVSCTGAFVLVIIDASKKSVVFGVGTNSNAGDFLAPSSASIPISMNISAIGMLTEVPVNVNIGITL